jgi:hypothetical protein
MALTRWYWKFQNVLYKDSNNRMRNNILLQLIFYFFLFFLFYRERKRGKNILEWNTLKNYAITNGIYDEKDVRYYNSNNRMRNNILLHDQENKIN